MLTTLILAGIASVVISVVVHFVLLHWQEIINWFSKWINRHQNVDKDAVGFTIKEAIESGQYNVVQGVFNKSSNTVEDVRRIKADNLDEQTRAQCYGKDKVTIFT
ncbi:MAG: hypothetical protein J5858_15005 [Lentisphaeria bacterium]|nr:hypothetical protein [Lentisphaeria bacterium]